MKAKSLGGLFFGLALVSALNPGCFKKKEITQVKETTQGKEATAGSESLASKLPKETGDLRDAILRLDGDQPDVADQLDAVLNDYVTKPELSQQPSTQFYVAQLKVLKSLRSIVWKASGVFESKDMKTDAQNLYAHNTAFSAFRGAAAGLAVLLPKTPAEIAFRYVTEPSADAKKELQEVSDLQDEIYDKLLDDQTGTLTQLIATLKSLQAVVTDANPIVWDNRMTFGNKSFSSNGPETYEPIGVVELKAALAAAHLAKHDLLVFCSYNSDATLRFYNSLSKRFGTDGLLGGKIHGLPVSDLLRDLTPQDKVAEPFKDLFTLRKTSGKIVPATMLAKALTEHLRPSVELMRDVFTGTKGRSMPRAVFVTSRLAPWELQTDEGLKNLELLVRGQTKLVSNITGEMATFNLPNFYLKPPQDLKKFLPITFETTEELYPTKHGQKYRNYRYGRPKDWDYNQFTDYLPSVTDAESMRMAARVLSHSVGGGFNNIPLVAQLEGQAQ